MEGRDPAAVLRGKGGEAVELNGVTVAIVPDKKSGRKLLARGLAFGVEARLRGPEDLEALAGELLAEAAAWRTGTRPSGPDPYRTLGVHPQASMEVITLLYKARARREHPDAGGDAVAWTRVQSAYTELEARRTPKEAPDHA